MSTALDADPAILAKLVKHSDPDVIQLATAAICSPVGEQMPLLLLADRFAELGDEDREQRARTLAALVARVPGHIAGFGQQSAELVFEYLPADQAVTAAWFALQFPTEHHPTTAATAAVRMAVLAPLGLAHPGAARWVVRTVDEFEETPWPRYGQKDWWRRHATARNTLREASISLLEFHQSFGEGSVRRGAWAAVKKGIRAAELLSSSQDRHTAAKRFRHRLASILELVRSGPVQTTVREAWRAFHFGRGRTQRGRTPAPVPTP